MRSDILQEAELLKKELKENLVPVNALLIRAKQLGLSICVKEDYNNPKDKDELVSPQVGIRFSLILG